MCELQASTTLKREVGECPASNNGERNSANEMQPWAGALGLHPTASMIPALPLLGGPGRQGFGRKSWVSFPCRRRFTRQHSLVSVRIVSEAQQSSVNFTFSPVNISYNSNMQP